MIKRAKLKTQQARVLELLWDKYGSYRLAGQLNYKSKTLLNVWKRTTGCVPLHEVGVIARHLRINKYLLNYEQVYRYEGKGNTFDFYIKDSELFDTHQMEYIFKGTPPCIKED